MREAFSALNIFSWKVLTPSSLLVDMLLFTKTPTCFRVAYNRDSGNTERVGHRFKLASSSCEAICSEATRVYNLLASVSSLRRLNFRVIRVEVMLR